MVNWPGAGYNLKCFDWVNKSLNKIDIAYIMINIKSIESVYVDLSLFSLQLL